MENQPLQQEREQKAMSGLQPKEGESGGEGEGGGGGAGGARIYTADKHLPPESHFITVSGI